MELKNLNTDNLTNITLNLVNSHLNNNAPEVEKEIVKKFFSISYEVLEQMKKETQEVIDKFNEVSSLFIERKKKKFSIKKLIGMHNKELEKEKEEDFQQKFKTLQNLIHKFPSKVDIYEEKISEVKKVLLAYHDETAHHMENLPENERLANTINTKTMLVVVDLLDRLKHSAYDVKNNGMTSFLVMQHEIIQEKVVATLDEQFARPVSKPDSITIDNIRKQFDQVFSAMDEIDSKKPKK